MGLLDCDRPHGVGERSKQRKEGLTSSGAAGEAMAIMALQLLWPCPWAADRFFLVFGGCLAHADGSRQSMQSYALGMALQGSLVWHTPHVSTQLASPVAEAISCPSIPHLRPAGRYLVPGF